MADHLKPGWQRVRLSDCCNEIGKRTENPSESGFDRFVGLEHLKTGEISIREWGDTSAVTSSMKLFEVGDVLVARRNVYLRRAALADFAGVCSGDAIVLRPTPEPCLPSLLPFILNTDQFWRYVTSQDDGTMSKRITVKRLMEYEFALPPLEEQQRIVRLLTAIAANLDALETAAVAAANLPNSIITNFLTRTFGSDKPLSFAAPVPATGVELLRAGKILKARQGLQIAQKNRHKKPGEGRYPYLNMRYLVHGGELEYVVPTSHRVVCTERDILITRTGSTNGAVFTNLRGAFHNNFFALDFDESRLLRDYIVAYLRHPQVHHLMQCLSGTTTVPDLNHGDFYSIPFPVPLLEDQQVLVEQHNQASEGAKRVAERAALAKRRFKSAIQNTLDSP